jgi:exodeoxyribonuclease V beta subunit
MKPADQLDIARAPLFGTTLVEASAGTGKTWTIAALYLRLVLERRLPVDQILVLTFGRAATAELRSRIRDRLAQVRDALHEGDLDALRPRDDALLALVGDTRTDAKRDAVWLAAAVESFDLAPILTIHGFAQRALAEHAFESGAPFATELAPDESLLIDEVAQDFFRRETGHASPLWARWLAHRGVTPGRLASWIREFQQKPYARVDGPPEPATTAEAAYVEAYEAAREAWWTGRDSIESALQSAMQANHIASRLRELDAYFGADVAVRDPVKQLVYFTPEKLASGKKRPASHPFLAAAGRLWEAAPAALGSLRNREAAMRARLAVYAHEELPRRKRERGLIGYGDVLADLASALDGPGGSALAASLRARYPVALLDEFQDTDPIQYAIFRNLYGIGAAAAADLAVYFVGDPKQAIYSFRGADVNAYLAARDEADVQRTLLVNRRSVTRLVSAVNAVFAGDAPFLAEQIGFAPSQPGPQTHAPLAIDGDDAAPFRIWFLPRDGTEPVGKGLANERAARATSREIARLLALAARGKATLGGKPVVGADIAVLVPSHRQGGYVQDALARLGVASVTYGQDSVYHSPEAVEVERILLAVAEPGREGLVRAALATDLFGRSGEEIAALATDAAAWDRILERIAGYHALAAEHGFARLWRALVEGEGVSARLLALRDGERRLTNLQHLADLLQDAALRQGLDLEGLARLLVRARTAATGDAEAEQLRLESDENLVKILTVHAAKGLEFPIVFCPFLWEGRERAEKGEIVACHENGRAVLDVGSERMDSRRQAAGHEELAERLRLAYVALTRAKHRCTVVWGAVNEGDNSPLAWLLHRKRGEAFAALDDTALRADLAGVVKRAEGAIEVRDMPAGAGEHVVTGEQDAVALWARKFDGRIPTPWRVSSFSGLLSQREMERPDYDALGAGIAGRDDETDGADLATPGALASRFAFPRGVNAGTLVHKVFESIDFAAPDGEPARRLIGDLLARFDFGPELATPLRAMVADALATPLDADRRLVLGRIAPESRIAELEFVFPVRVGAKPLPGGLTAPEGFLKGFIDLVFEFEGRYFVADWKSNWLGDTFESYAPERLANEMATHAYDAQALVYAMAVHRHLAARIPDYDYERQFGGVYYLFVRGMSAERGPERGVHLIRPSRREIDALADSLCGPVRSDE